MTDRIAEIRERCNFATPGPWRTEDNKKGTCIYDRHTWAKGLSPFAVIEPEEWRNIDFIAAAREDIPYLLAEVARLRGELLASKDAARAAQDANSEAGNTITQLQSEKWEAEEEVARLRQELEQAMRDMRGYCKACMHAKCFPMEAPCIDCNKVVKQHWQWRGPQPPADHIADVGKKEG